ncbi:MAG: hypothetical protein ACR2MB_04340 [Acidimicrobiales bacterium]
MNTSLEGQIIDFLQAVKRGEILLVSQRNPQKVYAGNIEYVASNGWRITVFNDANEWDYLDSVIFENGETYTSDDLDEIDSIRNYQASEEVSWRCYGIPGFSGFRCLRCGRKVEPVRALLLEDNNDSGLLCSVCFPR